MAEKSQLSIDIERSQVLFVVGQADDVVLLSNDINHILDLNPQYKYSEQFNVKLSSNKTKLLEIFPPRQKCFISRLNNETIEYTECRVSKVM